MMPFAFSVDGLSAEVQGVDIRRNGAVETTLVFRRGGESIFEDTVRLSEAEHRLTLAQVLARLTPIPEESLRQDLIRLLAELRASAAGPAVGALPARVNGAELRAEALNPDDPGMDYLPVFGRDGFVIRGASHLSSGYPKSGKTTLYTALVVAWAAAGETVLWITEEPKVVWKNRLKKLPGAWGQVEFLFALGSERTAIVEAMAASPETVVVLDTTRLLRIAKENDPSEVNLAMTPIIAAARVTEKTLILLHHTRKGGGEHGEAAAGAHTFAGVVDVIHEVQFEKSASNRRLLKAWGRGIDAADLVYEKRGEDLLALGDPEELGQAAAETLVADLAAEEWQETRLFWNALRKQHSHDVVLRALIAQAKAGTIERDPPIDAGSKAGKKYRWRRPPAASASPENLTSAL